MEHGQDIASDTFCKKLKGGGQGQRCAPVKVGFGAMSRSHTICSGWFSLVCSGVGAGGSNARILSWDSKSAVQRGGCVAKEACMPEKEGQCKGIFGSGTFSYPALGGAIVGAIACVVEREHMIRCCQSGGKGCDTNMWARRVKCYEEV
eukprot:8432178-Ditylum_brightwellii.AAC.1